MHAAASRELHFSMKNHNSRKNHDFCDTSISTTKSQCLSLLAKIPFPQCKYVSPAFTSRMHAAVSRELHFSMKNQNSRKNHVFCRPRLLVNKATVPLVDCKDRITAV